MGYTVLMGGYTVAEGGTGQYKMEPPGERAVGGWVVIWKSLEGGK